MSVPLDTLPDEPTPHPLTGGVGCTETPSRDLPQIPFCDVPSGYGVILAQGFDTWQETWRCEIPDRQWRVLEGLQAQARDHDDGAGVPVRWGNEVLQMRPHGAKGGVRFVLGNDDLLFMVRSPKNEWTVTVRFLAAGLWEHGHEKLAARAANAVQGFGLTLNMLSDEARIGRVDFCFDIYSPQFSKEFQPGLSQAVVCHSSTKSKEKLLAGTHARGGKGETLTIGMKKALEVEVYDKIKEITEASGKAWMYEVWAQALHGEIPESDVWRLEVRMGKDFLRTRGIICPHHVIDHLDELIAEALITRRLTRPKKRDKNRRRWPMHPLWVMAFNAREAGSMRPLGRQITTRREALEQMIVKQVAGTLRSVGVLRETDADETELTRIARQAVEEALTDPKHGHKIERAKERYRNIDEAI